MKLDLPDLSQEQTSDHPVYNPTKEKKNIFRTSICKMLTMELLRRQAPYVEKHSMNHNNHIMRESNQHQLKRIMSITNFLSYVHIKFNVIAHYLGLSQHYHNNGVSVCM